MFHPRSLVTAIRSALGRATQAGRVPAATVLAETSPGQSGTNATTEVDPSALGRSRWGYAPSPDGELDPGEIVWTWVPYEERDGRGKDRPVLILAALAERRMLAVALTSKDHGDDAEYVALGVGPWDHDGRPSWAGVGRVFSVSQGGVRREGAVVDAAGYARIERTLRARHGWT